MLVTFKYLVNYRFILSIWQNFIKWLYYVFLFTYQLNIHIILLNGRICHFTNEQVLSFNTKLTIYRIKLWHNIHNPRCQLTIGPTYAHCLPRPAPSRKWLLFIYSRQCMCRYYNIIPKRRITEHSEYIYSPTFDNYFLSMCLNVFVPTMWYV